MDILEAMAQRVSVRTFLTEPIPSSELEEIRLSGVVSKALTEAEIHFHLCSEQQIGREIKGILGNYGRIIRAPHYLVVTAKGTRGLSGGLRL